MKEFDLEKAKAGEPVMLRDGTKAFVLGLINPEFNMAYPMRGYVHTQAGIENFAWTLDGRFSSLAEHTSDIVGMWEEKPQPRVNVVIPAPLKEPREGMYYIEGKQICKPVYTTDNKFLEVYINSTFYFATEADARAFLEAMENSRR